MTPSTATGSAPRVLWLVGLAAAVLLALLISPATRWLVRSQATVAGLTLQSSSSLDRRAAATQKAFAARHPDDLQIQIAAAITGNVVHSVSEDSDNTGRVAALRALTGRFPNSPSLYANLLRHEIGQAPENRALPGSGVYLTREEEWTLQEGQPRAHPILPPPPAPDALAAFDADAAAGGRLDPSNAYFPMMRAIGLFAAHRDAEALEAVRRAGSKSTWRAYVADESEGKLRLADAAWGHASALGRLAIAESIMYPEYADLRGAARISVALAMADEQGGRVTVGLATRHALLRVGGLMRADSEPYIGSLVGIAVAAIATSRPGGAPIVEARPNADQVARQKYAQQRLQLFADYARRAGRPDDAVLAKTEISAGDATRAIDRSPNDPLMTTFASLGRLGMSWLADLMTLDNIFWLLVLAGAASLLSRLPAVRAGLPLSPPARWGILATIVAAIVIVAAKAGLLADAGNDVTLQLGVPLAVLVGLPLICLATVGVVRGLRALREDRSACLDAAQRFGKAFMVSSVALLCLLGLSTWLGHGVADYGSMLREWGLTGNSIEDPTAAADRIQAEEQLIFTILAGMCLPLLMLIVLSIVGRVRRVPVSVALVRGFQSAALPAACVLVLIYGVLALGTARQERMMNASLKQIIRHEGAYYASLAGVPWPGPPAR